MILAYTIAYIIYVVERARLSDDSTSVVMNACKSVDFHYHGLLCLTLIIILIVNSLVYCLLDVTIKCYVLVALLNIKCFPEWPCSTFTGRVRWPIDFNII